MIWRTDAQKLKRVKKEKKKDKKESTKKIKALRKVKAPTVRDVLSSLTNTEILRSAKKLPPAYFPSAARPPPGGGAGEGAGDENNNGGGNMEVFESLTPLLQKQILCTTTLADLDRRPSDSVHRGKGLGKNAPKRVVALAHNSVDKVKVFC
jgi:hypothetical protein